jgi:16S rRNA (cytidine1402-2'-O)-methyltransferase
VALWEELARWPYPAVAFESPRRLPASLATLAAAMPDRPVAVCRELTKRFEEVIRGTAAEVAAQVTEPPKGEITLVLGEQPAVKGDEQDALAAVAELVEAGSGRRQAADVVARLTGLSRNRLYRASL